MPEKAKAKKQPKAKPGRLKRWLVGIGIGTPLTILVLWILVHRVPWLGPLIANSLRAVVGADNVARLEDFVYGIEDSYNRWTKGDEKPKAYWEVPDQPKPVKPVASDAADAGPTLPPFELEAVGPMHESWSAPGDGKWVRIVDPRRPNEPTTMYKTLIHPDRNRSWAELFVVAVDLRRAQLIPVPGYREPKATTEQGKQLERPAKIPKKHHEELLAAFNGGFMSEHGRWGMMVDGVTISEPREHGCAIVEYRDGSLEIATWKSLADEKPRMRWYRQTPPCMFEDGKMHAGLASAEATRWGATLDGDTVIRRSAIGLNQARDVLYVGISNHTSARAIAQGMHHAGAADVAQLDVNWSYPKFVLFEPGDAGPERKAVALAEGFEFSEDEYIRSRSLRDFFYLLRKPPEAAAAN